MLKKKRGAGSRASRDQDAIYGHDGQVQSLVRQIIGDGFEPFATAGVPGVGLVMSFRKPAEHPDLRQMPGQYL